MARIPGIAVGLAVGAVAVIAAPVLARHMRPVAKAALKAAVAAAEEVRIRVAELGETAEDMLAEVRAERAAWNAEAASASEQAQPSTPEATPGVV
jgi:hypothetical protein